MVHVCPRCNYQNKNKSNLRYHFNRIHVCCVRYENVSIEACKKLLENNELRVTNKILANKISNERISNEIDNLKSQIKIQQNEIETLRSQKVSNIKINNNINIINFNINSYENTNYEAIRDKIKDCLEENVPNFEKLIKLIHFNKDLPENHNIFISNKKTKDIVIFDGERFIEQDRLLVNIKDDVLNKVIYSIQPWMVKYTKKQDSEYHESVDKEITKTLYNGRELVKQTRKLVNL